MEHELGELDLITKGLRHGKNIAPGLVGPSSVESRW